MSQQNVKINNLVDKLIAPIVIGTLIACVLWAVQLVATVYYWVKVRGRDHWLIPAVLAVLLLSTTVQLVTEQSLLYIYTVRNWGNVEFFFGGDQPWQTVAILLWVGVVAFIVQAFLIARYWRLSRNWYLSIFMLCVAIALIVVDFIGSIERLSVDGTLNNLLKLQRLAVSYLAGEVFLDLLIAVALAYQLNQYRNNTAFEETKNMLTRLILLSLETGFVTTAWALVVLGIYIAFDNNNLPLGALCPLASCYAISLIVNLLIRKSVKPTLPMTSPHSTGKLHSEKGKDVRRALSEIHVQTIVRVEAEDPDEEEGVIGLQSMSGQKEDQPDDIPSLTPTPTTAASDIAMEREQEKALNGGSLNMN